MTIESLNIVRKHYPNARSTNDTVNRMLDLMKVHFNLDPNQIILADSICSDDVNTMEYPSHAYEMVGPFKMGGLDGFPFTGLTGMSAFAHHVPENGAVFIYYAPHIGITRSGATGEILRTGQHTASACCGAAKAALGKLLDNKIKAGEITELDYQQNHIEQILYKQKKRIAKASDKLMEATQVIYEAIEARINILAERTDYPCQYLILMGGILINGDHDMGSYNALRRFEVRNLISKEKWDFKGKLEE